MSLVSKKSIKESNKKRESGCGYWGENSQVRRIVPANDLLLLVIGYLYLFILQSLTRMTPHIREILNKDRYLLPRGLQRWWGPVWRGLTVEPTAKHYRSMGKAVWLYLYLIVHANRKTGILFRLVSVIAADMGLPVRTVGHWLAKLRKGEYIQTVSNGRGLIIAVLKWKPIGRKV